MSGPPVHRKSLLGSAFTDHRMVDQRGVIRRHELTDQDWALLAPLIPRAVTGRPRVEDRQVIDGMAYKIPEPGTKYFLGENRGGSYRFSRAVIDAGADAVVGSGPHVIRGMEFCKGRLIACSLGNFNGCKVLGRGGTLSTSGVLQVILRPDGTYVSGRLRQTQIVEPGTPEPGGEAIDLVPSVSEKDFGSHAARISADGTSQRP
ncbi:CapA family protein [Streptomyces sp. NPDC002676]